MAQLGSALRSGRKGHRFESGYPDMMPTRLDPFVIWLMNRSNLCSGEELAGIRALLREYAYCIDHQIELPCNGPGTRSVQDRARSFRKTEQT